MNKSRYVSRFSTRVSLSLVAVVALTLLPMTLREAPVGEQQRVISWLQYVTARNHSLASETMRLRLGTARSYDSLDAEMDALTRGLEKLEEIVVHSNAPWLDEWRGDFSVRGPQVEELGRLVEEFPTHNATFIYSLRALPRVFEYLVQEQGPSAFSAEHEEMYRELLGLHASWNGDEAAAFLERFDGLLGNYGGDPGSLGVFSTHCRVSVEERLNAEANLEAILALTEGLELEDYVPAAVLAFNEWLVARNRTRSITQASCYLLAMSLCASLAIAATRVTQRLTDEMREKERLADETQRYEIQLRHAQKLESVGQLAAGIAHEINTPTQYVSDNTQFLQEAFEELSPLLNRMKSIDDDTTESGDTETELRAFLEDIELDYLCEEVPRSIKQSIEGLQRISKIVRAMKEFSHPGMEGMHAADINRNIESTVTVAGNEWKYVAELELDLDPSLPPVPCFISEVNQVVLNIVINAAHAIDDVRAEGEKGTIKVQTLLLEDEVEIRISDTGGGIPPEVKDRIFDPFFTTKEVGKGTGQGLAIAHGVIVQKHGGTIDVETEPGVGSTFVLRLPLDQGAEKPSTAAEAVVSEVA